jgi:GNAT superfamily N-acetyltransferase
MDEIQIRFAKEQDLQELIILCEAHAEYEKTPYDKSGKMDRLKAQLFSENPVLYCLVVEKDNMLIGYATYMKQFSTWDASFYIYMDCLFMQEASRGLEIGKQLVAKIKEESTILGCKLIQWQTPDFNTRAINFYHRIGATSKTKERFFLTLE